MRDLLGPLLQVCVVLLVPVLPFLFFGSRVDGWVDEWKANPPSPGITAAVIIALLSSDIFLPIPSSVISTFGGWQLGTWPATAASWVGLCIGATIGFALARAWGRPFALLFSRPGNLERMNQLSDRYGAAFLIFTRGVPVLAEASVLLVGIHRLSWRKFLPPMLLSNLGIALAYSAFGQVAERYHLFPLALGVSIALPVLLAMVISPWLRTESTGNTTSEPRSMKENE